MQIHALQHVPFEGLGSIETWAFENGHTVRYCPLYLGAPLPDIRDVELLVVLGGPMSVHDAEEYPWMVSEKRFLRLVIANKKPILGICLGAQLLAEVLGGRVTKGAHREIGWFPVQREDEIKASRFGSLLPEQFEAFHWHGDTFSLPPGALRLGKSEACANQGFIWQEHVIGLQFHLETTQDSADKLIHYCSRELAQGGPYVQSGEAMMARPQRFVAINRLMQALLDRFAPDTACGI